MLFCMTHSAAGGLREIWSDVAEGLAARGHRVGRFVLYPPADPASEGIDRKAWHHIAESAPRSPLSALRLLYRLIVYLRRVRPAAVVTAMPAANVLVPLAVRLAGSSTRVFLSHHSPTHSHNRLLDRLDGWTGCLRCVAGVISVSDAVAATLAHKSACYRTKCRTIHNALPELIERLIDDRRDEAGGAREPRRVVALGRLSYQKNYPMLLAAVARAPGIVLEIIGGGEDEAELRAQVDELGIVDRVIFAGVMPRAAALERAGAGAMFVQVSRYEGHSLALIEAARLGLPLIVSDIPEQVDAITAADGTRCGIAVPLGDVDGLARQIIHLAEDPAAAAHFSAAARRIAAERSNRQMIDIYEQMLVGGAQPR